VSCAIVRTRDGGALFICGLPPPRRCSFCKRAAVAECDFKRCRYAMCDRHRWQAAAEIDFCPQHEAPAIAQSSEPLQTALF
jgi:hypothetical protein